VNLEQADSISVKPEGDAPIDQDPSGCPSDIFLKNEDWRGTHQFVLLSIFLWSGVSIGVSLPFLYFPYSKENQFKIVLPSLTLIIQMYTQVMVRTHFKIKSTPLTLAH